MRQIIAFILKRKRGTVFLLLFSASSCMIFLSRVYHNGLYVSSKNKIFGTVLSMKDYASSYIGLRYKNHALIEENIRLREKMLNSKTQNIVSNTLQNNLIDYQIHSANVIKNSFNKAYNYLTIDKGTREGIKQDMGVINSNGIMGIVESVSDNFATVQSILNKKSLINAGIKHTNYFGTLHWEAEDWRYAILSDIPKLYNAKVGDTVITAGMSHIFPRGLPIGKITSIYLDNSKNYYKIRLKLFADMSHIYHVYIIENKYREEIINIEKQTDKGE